MLAYYNKSSGSPRLYMSQQRDDGREYSSPLPALPHLDIRREYHILGCAPDAEMWRRPLSRWLVRFAPRVSNVGLAPQNVQRCRNSKLSFPLGVKLVEDALLWPGSTFSFVAGALWFVWLMQASSDINVATSWRLHSMETSPSEMVVISPRLFALVSLWCQFAAP